MKINILLFVSFLFISCSNIIDIPSPTIPKEEALILKDQLRSDFTYANCENKVGVNCFYRYGFYIYGLHKHNILTSEDVQDYCNLARYTVVEEENGMHSLPNWIEVTNNGDHGRFMSRDDYFGLLLGMYYGHNYNKCTEYFTDIMVKWWNDKKIKIGDGSIWSPQHEAPIKRANRSNMNYFIMDMIDYFSTCNSDSTSSNLLAMTRLLVAKDFEPSYYTEKLYTKCKDKYSYNELLNIYYGDNPLGKLLQNTL